MKQNFRHLVAVVSIAMASAAFAPAILRSASPIEGMKTVNALEFRMINSGYPISEKVDPYLRIPLEYKDSVVSALWNNAICSAGIAIRFASDSRSIGTRYCLKKNNHMNHMADCGIKGTDLYVLGDNGKWEFVNSVRPANDTLQTGLYVKNLDGRMHEYMIYLPLYDGIRWMEIAVDQDASIQKPQVDNPKASRGKVVWYGTSILQGGCASRTGMAATNIIQRELGIECVNIATSGQGKMYFPMARALARVDDVAAYVVDPVPNCTLEQCDTLTVRFVNILRKAHPDVPVIMVEGPMYPYWKHDSYFREYLPRKNAAFRKCYEQLKKENPRNLYYVTWENLNGYEGEGTVDGIHCTDLGFRSYADKLEPVLRKALGRKLK